MKTTTATFFALLAGLVNADAAFDAWKMAFIREQIVPDIIPSNNFSAILEITYNFNGTAIPITPAKNVTRARKHLAIPYEIPTNIYDRDCHHSHFRLEDGC
jgi:hypothetical protein